MKISSLPVLVAPLAALALLAGCAAQEPEVARATAPSAEPTPQSPSTAPVEPEEDRDAADSIAGTVVRFASEEAQVDVTIDEDTPAVRDFLSMLPLTLELEEFSGREKIAYLPRELDAAGTPGSDPENGDLIYYTPWGNLGFYYNAEGIGYSDTDLHIGTYDATREQLDLLEGEGVTVEIMR